MKNKKTEIPHEDDTPLVELNKTLPNKPPKQDQDTLPPKHKPVQYKQDQDDLIIG